MVPQVKRRVYVLARVSASLSRLTFGPRCFATSKSGRSPGPTQPSAGAFLPNMSSTVYFPSSFSSSTLSSIHIYSRFTNACLTFKINNSPLINLNYGKTRSLFDNVSYKFLKFLTLTRYEHLQKAFHKFENDSELIGISMPG